MPKYEVLVDDNSHYRDEDARWRRGAYETLAEALAVCRLLVEQSLDEGHKPGISADRLYEHYTLFGDDPFIVVIEGQDEAARFSGWDYAKARCGERCGGQSD
jgi:hypothetical protein